MSARNFYKIALFLYLLAEFPCQKIVIQTREDAKEYNFLPFEGDYIQFDVKASSDIHVALTETFTFYGKYYEIVFGGWNNTKSVIRRDDYKNHMVVRNGSIIIPDLFETYWIQINKTCNLITTGKLPNSEALMSFKDSDPIKISHVGISTGYGSSGEWHIDAKYLTNSKCSNNYY